MKNKNRTSFVIEGHDRIDKSFMVYNDHITLNVEYDDVNHVEVEAAIEHIKEILDKHWDESVYDQKYKENILKVWYLNEYNIQDDYDNNIEEYLNDNI
jgi:hypothetical protein